jgi:hypothetical protein
MCMFVYVMCVSVQYVVYVCVFDVYPLQVFCQEVHSELLPLLDLGADKTVLFSGTNLLAKPPQISSDLRLVLHTGSTRRRVGCVGSQKGTWYSGRVRQTPLPRR